MDDGAALDERGKYVYNSKYDDDIPNPHEEIEAKERATDPGNLHWKRLFTQVLHKRLPIAKQYVHRYDKEVVTSWGT